MDLAEAQINLQARLVGNTTVAV